MITHQQFYYVRHGQTDWNLNKRLQGNTDIPLNDTGIAQAHEAKDKLAGQPVSAIFTSPLQRARKTADIINETLQCPIFEITGLKECNFGPHEGTESYGWLADWLTGDDVEPYHDFLDRARDAINQALTNPGPVLIVAHGGIYMPIRDVLPPSKMQVLPNGQPVRHDPPANLSEGWQAVHL